MFTAFVLTDTEQDGMLLGYEGALLDLRQSPSGEVRVIVLKDAEPFVVQLKADSARRQPDPHETKSIGVLTIEGAHIKNIAFRPFLDPRRLSDEDYLRMKADGELDPVPDVVRVPAEPAAPPAAKRSRGRRTSSKKTAGSTATTGPSRRETVHATPPTV